MCLGEEWKRIPKRHICCSRRCGNAYGDHRSEKKRASMLKAVTARHAQTREVILQKIQGMDPWAIYQYGVLRGRNGLYQKLVRKGAIEPKFTPRATERRPLQRTA